MEDFEDFIKYLNDNMVKLKELLEKITTLHSKAAIGLLETSAVYNPSILVDLLEMSCAGRKYDQYILEGEDFKSELERALAVGEEESQDTLAELELLRKAIADNFLMDLNDTESRET